MGEWRAGHEQTKDGRGFAGSAPDILSALREDPASFAGETRLAAVVKWYEMHELSPAKTAEIAGLSRSESLSNLTRFGVSPF